MLKRLVIRLAAVYLLIALVGRFVEGTGATTCGCKPDCWCKRPVLSTFRWVLPYGHSQWSVDEKAELAADG